MIREERHARWRRGLLAAMLAMIAGPVAAQDSSPAASSLLSAGVAESESDIIIVTGSLIRNELLPHAAPVQMLAAEDLRLRGFDDIEQALRQMPGIVPSIGSAVNNGNGGSAYVNLRGLGTNRNLVLVDGDRLTPAGLDGQFDLNNIPLALVERIDVLTGGASTTYGADAISGVVNLVLRKDFSGLALSASSGVSEQGDGAGLRADLTAGTNFADGRGNLTLSFGYLRQDPVYQGARPFSATSLDSASGLPTGSPVSTPAILSAVSDSGADFIALGCGAGTGIACATDVQGPRQIGGDGTAFSPAQLYHPYNTNPATLLQTPFERFNVMGQGHYELSDALRFDVRGIYSHNRVSTRLAPSGAFTDTVEIPLNNPFLTPALRTGLCQYDLNPGPDYVPRLSAAECAAAALASGPDDPDYRSLPLSVLRRATELGPRQSLYATDYFDAEAGLGGPLAGKIDWDVKFSYGESRKTQTQSGYWRTSRLQQALLAGPDGCFDPSDGCVPVDIFGPDGAITADMNEFLHGQAQTRTRTSMWQLKGRIAGDTALRLPWADSPVAIAVGAEYRSLKASQQSDLLLQTGDLGGTSGAEPDISGRYRVAEAVAEVHLPLVEDVPGIARLTLGGGLRFTHTSIASGEGRARDAWTWNAESNWDIVDGLRIRGSYARAIRAPNIGELFYPAVNMPINVPLDPCAGLAPAFVPDLREICLAQGANIAQIGSIQPPALGQINARSSGNPDLRPEKSNSWTVGAVIAPNAAPGLRLSVDYFNIRIRDAIAMHSAADVLLGCFAEITPDSASSDACLSIRRNPATGALDAGAPGVLLPLANMGGFATDGIDVALDYTTALGSDVRVGIGLFANWTNRLRAQGDAGQPWRECAGHYSISCTSIQPRFALQQQTRLSLRNFDLALNWRFIGKVQYEPRQYAEDLEQAEMQGCRDPLGADPDNCMVNPAFRHIPASSYFDLTARANISPDLAFTLTVFNLFDRQPPIVGDTIGTASFNSGNTYPASYDSIGRRFRVGAELRF